MEVQTVDSLSPVAADHDPVRCLLAIELSKKSWIVAITTTLSDKISQYTLDGCDWKGLLELMERVRTRVAREVGRPVEMISCYEAGYDGFWLHRLLERHGVRSHVIDPASVQVDRRARRAKTDHIDAKRLLRSLMAYLRGEPKVWSVLRVPSVAEEDERRLNRERDRMRRLEQLHTGYGRELPPRLKAEIARELQRLELILGMLKEIEAERDAIALTENVSAHTNAKKIQNLVKLKAIGAEIATVLTGEVFYRPFNNRHQVASYVGLTPSPFQSGSKCRDQGISKAGNPKARSTMIELAWLWLRHQPDSPLSVWFRERVGILKGRIRRITIVAGARKLLIALWRYLETGMVPTGAVLN